MEKKYEDTDESTDIRPTMLFCEQHGWTGVTEGICYGSTSCTNAAICVLASNFAGRHGQETSIQGAEK